MRKILFVEDNALIVRLYSQRLVEQGFDVAVAEDGLEAMKQLPEFRPDLVVLDLLMPKMSGADVLKFMRQHPDLKDTRVIVFSNAYLSSLGEQVSSMGVEAILAKTAVTPMRLVEAIRKALANLPVETRAAPASSPGKKEPPPSPKAEPPPHAPPEPAVPRESDSEFVTRIGQQFLERVPAVFKELRQLCHELLEAANSEREPGCLQALSRKAGFLTQITGMAGYHRTAELPSALEALLFELVRRPGEVTDSARQTIAATIVFLADRFDRREYLDEQTHPPANVLVVDDDAVSSLAVVQSLQRAKLTAVGLTDPLQALEKLRQGPFDAVLLDVSMPGMDGLALCEQMRSLPLHKRTPVIFVTGRTDFKMQARSILSGGNDLIAKPISPNELCVKVVTHVLRKR